MNTEQKYDIVSVSILVTSLIAIIAMLLRLAQQVDVIISSWIIAGLSFLLFLQYVYSTRLVRTPGNVMGTFAWLAVTVLTIAGLYLRYTNR